MGEFSTVNENTIGRNGTAYMDIISEYSSFRKSIYRSPVHGSQKPVQIALLFSRAH